MKTMRKVNGIRKISIVGMMVVVAAVALSVATSHAAVIVAENFGGTGTDNLNTTTADTFASGITTAGGSSAWAAPTSAATFFADGSIVNADNKSAFLNMGSYINDTKGTATGKFTVSATVAEYNKSWAGFGFFESNTPNVDSQFTSADAAGMGIFIYRGTKDLDGFAGPLTGGGVDGGATTYTGDQLLSIVLDLTPTGGYNGTDNFGTITFIRGDVDTGTPIGGGTGSFTYTADQSYGSVGLTATGLGNGGFSSFQVTQVPEPASLALVLGMGGLLIAGRRLVTKRRSTRLCD